MQRPSSYKRLCGLLIMLLLTNSSMALEFITHDGHQHAASSGYESHSMASHDASTMDSTNPAMEQGDKDCLCDDICCVSSVGFGSISSQRQSLPNQSLSSRFSNHYQSIALDLLLPPPTR
ncbi:MAG: hypothetical protein O2971_03215 [Proteobacteria bacterium]|nr:hypothetical protein [Pseudomonadota bacterium]